MSERKRDLEAVNLVHNYIKKSTVLGQYETKVGNRLTRMLRSYFVIFLLPLIWFAYLFVKYYIVFLITVYGPLFEMFLEIIILVAIVATVYLFRGLRNPDSRVRNMGHFKDKAQDLYNTRFTGQKKKLAKLYQAQNQAEYFMNQAEAFEQIPQKYHYDEALNAMRHYLSSNKAQNIEAAINMYEEDLRWEMIYRAEQMAKQEAVEKAIEKIKSNR